jgi:hypothetical protein
MGITNSAEKSSVTKTVSVQSKTSSDTVVDWLSVYAQVYRETLTPELIVAYQSSLADVNPEILHKAFLRAMRSSTFRPTPAEVIQAATVEIENAPKPKQLDLPPLNETDRKAVQQCFDELAQRLKIPSRGSGDTKERMAELQRQRDQVLEKFPSPRKP